MFGKYGIIAAIIIIALFAFSGMPALYYSAIVFAAFASIAFFQKIAEPPKIAKAEFEKFGAKYSKKVLLVDALSIILVLAGATVFYFVFAFLKNQIYSNFQGFFVSNPQGLLFIAAFLISLGSVGWLIRGAVKILFGDEYWKYYYNRPEVGFDTKKIYRIISICTILLAVPALMLGFNDYSIVMEQGILLNDWTRLEPQQIAWSQISGIRLAGYESNDFYIIDFTTGEKWNLSNENWNASESEVIGFISQKSGVQITYP
ncbi:MAG: hypothetical protein COV47_02060 [Candidatus Diapherotrites archaeon CG11_big_fil_rev_8_21_14_0_20_37_9]|nr:MAG: hypothetical protein COV47_02060 [Candidatus Diapherotrites archaeon CG11_big_fil_rev_8_21_14_0_20_37_9]